MCAISLTGLSAIIPATALLTVSFFVLLVIRKIETGGLKVFGYVITALLWLSAALVFSGGAAGCYPWYSPMQKTMKGKMHGMMMKDKAPLAMPAEKGAMKDKMPPAVPCQKDEPAGKR